MSPPEERKSGKLSLTAPLIGINLGDVTDATEADADQLRRPRKFQACRGGERVTIASPPPKRSAPTIRSGSADKAKCRFGQQNHASGQSIQLAGSEPFEPEPAITPLPEHSDASGAIPPVPLAMEIRRAGMLYREFWRQGNVAIYCAKDNGPRIEYEVFQVQLFPAEEVNGRSYPAREGFPKNSEWGELGFTYANNSHCDPASAALAKAQGLLYWKDTALGRPLKGALAE